MTSINPIVFSAILLLNTLPISAASYTEAADAGSLTATAQAVNTQPGGTMLSSILGTLDAGDIDLFRIYLTGGQTFSATTINATFFDSHLLLFDSAGLGVYANDDSPDSPPQSTLPTLTFSPAASGVYYLAITGAGVLPLSSGGLIFPSSGGFLDQTGASLNAVGPTGPGAALALTGWTGSSSESGEYQIDLTGAEFLPDAAVPEPGTGLLAGACLLLAVASRLRQRRAGTEEPRNSGSTADQWARDRR